jgi:Ca2+-binding EF-hand superfamily protein
MFEKYGLADTDGDGKLSWEEALAAGMDSETFKRMDADGNGFLTQEEFGAWLTKDREC